MNEVLRVFLSLPDWLIYAIVGAVGGGVGALIGQAVARAFKMRKAVPIAGIIAAVVCIKIANSYVPTAQASATLETAMSRLSEQRLFQTLFRIHPEAQTELRTRLAAIIVVDGALDEEVFLGAQAAAADIVGRHLTKDLLSLPDAMLHKLLLRQVDVMRQFQAKPAQCVAYYLGKPEFGRDELSAEFIETESNLKADAFESAAANPTALTAAADEADLGEELALAYVARGYPVEDLQKVGAVETLPAEEGCRLALQFVDAIAALGPAQSAYLFKNLVVMGQRAN